MKIICKQNISYCVAFVDMLSPHALAVEAGEGIKAEALIAQSASETAWGRNVLIVSVGGVKRVSNNYFNIKKGSAWTGQTGWANVPEYLGKVWKNIPQEFRVYNNLTEALSDYVGLIKNNPRYADAWKVRGDACAYIDAIAKAGYATDPKYAVTIKSIITNSLLRV